VASGNNSIGEKDSRRLTEISMSLSAPSELRWYRTEFNALILGLGEIHVDLKLMGCTLIRGALTWEALRAHREHVLSSGLVSFTIEIRSRCESNA
jgi:hypothetical protein